MDFDSWYTTPPEARIVCECDCCGGEIYEGEDIYEIDSDVLHVDCFIDWCFKYFNPQANTAGRNI
jgi:hypothetical protein